MSLPQTLILVLYFFVLSILAIYGWHRYYLVYLYMKNRGRAPEPLPPPDPADLPRVTIQLPRHSAPETNRHGPALAIHLRHG